LFLLAVLLLQLGKTSLLRQLGNLYSLLHRKDPSKVGALDAKAFTGVGDIGLIGFLAFLFGLAVVMPVLGHSTWHLYRKVVEPDMSPRPKYEPRPEVRRYAADFPAVLFSSRRPKTG
jgi:hypothetical protein